MTDESGEVACVNCGEEAKMFVYKDPVDKESLPIISSVECRHCGHREVRE